SDRVDQEQPAVVGSPLLRPEDSAGLLVERDSALDDFVRFDAFGVGDEHAAACDGRSRVSAADRGSPADGKFAFGKRVENARLIPQPDAAGAAPLGPIVRAQSDDRDGYQPDTRNRHDPTCARARPRRRHGPPLSREPRSGRSIASRERVAPCGPCRDEGELTTGWGQRESLEYAGRPLSGCSENGVAPPP